MCFFVRWAPRYAFTMIAEYISLLYLLAHFSQSYTELYIIVLPVLLAKSIHKKSAITKKKSSSNVTNHDDLKTIHYVSDVSLYYISTLTCHQLISVYSVFTVLCHGATLSMNIIKTT